MYWKDRTIKEQFKEEMLQRSRSEPRTRFLDFEKNKYILLRSCDDTIEFLRNSTIQEIAWACEILDEMDWAFSIDKAAIVLKVF